MKNTLARQIKKILFYEWDPIGVHEIFEWEDDEYDGYIPELLTILTQQRSVDAVEKYLLWAEQEHMGLKPNLAHTKAIAQKLIDLMDKRDLEKANASGSKDDE